WEGGEDGRGSGGGAGRGRRGRGDGGGRGGGGVEERAGGGVLPHGRLEGAVGPYPRQRRLGVRKQRFLLVDLPVLADAVDRVVDLAHGGARGSGAGTALR